MKKTQINLALNALALAGMLVFASQAANAASISDSSPDPTPAAVHSAQSVADDATPDVADTNEIADVSDTNEIENNVADISAEDINLPDASEVEASTELEQEGPSSN
jgi:hypothetical protein